MQAYVDLDIAWYNEESIPAPTSTHAILGHCVRLGGEKRENARGGETSTIIVTWEEEIL